MPPRLSLLVLLAGVIGATACPPADDLPGDAGPQTDSKGRCRTVSIDQLPLFERQLCPERIDGPITELASCGPSPAGYVAFGRCDGVRTLVHSWGSHDTECNYDESGKLAGVVITHDVLAFCQGTSASVGAGLAVSCYRRQMTDVTKVTCKNADGGARD